MSYLECHKCGCWRQDPEPRCMDRQCRCHPQNRTEADILRARIAELEAERDAHKADAQERTTMAARAQEALRYVMNGLPANDPVWAAYGNADSARAWLAERDAKMQADLEAARAGETRAVEVVQKMLKSAVPNRRDHPTMWDAWAFATKFLEGNPPALDWLAQVNREAAAEELEKLGPLGSSNQELFMVPWGEIKQRAAALRAGKGVPHA